MVYEKDVSRRAVLCGLALLTLGLIPENAIAASGVKVLANGKVEITLPKNPALKKVGGVVQFTNNQGIDIALVRTGKGATAFKALNLACTHQGYPLRKEGNKWVCDNHLSNFSIAGAVTKGPAESPLQNIPLKATRTKVTVG
ncbi:MAG: Rieske 2Fe-2S domain-containing protein [Actinobacteria bacterium]|nr:Rieske 2Fe-2S domain-containing protein [Actinomycetota bacterium]